MTDVDEPTRETWQAEWLERWATDFRLARGVAANYPLRFAMSSATIAAWKQRYDGIEEWLAAQHIVVTLDESMSFDDWELTL